MEEIKFPAKLRNGGKVKIITVPKDYIEYYQLNEDEFVEVVIRKKQNATSGIQNQYFQVSEIHSDIISNNSYSSQSLMGSVCVWKAEIITSINSDVAKSVIGRVNFEQEQRNKKNTDGVERHASLSRQEGLISEQSVLIKCHPLAFSHSHTRHSEKYSQKSTATLNKEFIGLATLHSPAGCEG